MVRSSFGRSRGVLTLAQGKPHPWLSCNHRPVTLHAKACIAPGLALGLFGGGRWAFRLRLRVRSSHRNPPPPAAPYLVLAPRATGSPASSSFLLESAASVPLHTLRREWAGTCSQRLAAVKFGCPLTPPLTLVLHSFKKQGPL